MSGSHDERRRLQGVYAGYDATSRARWSDDNAGNRAMRAEREAHLERVLRASLPVPFEVARVVDVGCGYGHVLAWLESIGFAAENLVGVDLMPNRVEASRATFPRYDFRAGDVEEVTLPAGSFDLAVCFTLFSSIIEVSEAQRVATAIARLLKQTGAVLWYDIRLPSTNANVRPIRRREVAALFPGFRPALRSLTVMPPLSRRLGPATAAVYPLLAGLPLLRTHLSGVLLRHA